MMYDYFNIRDMYLYTRAQREYSSTNLIKFQKVYMHILKNRQEIISADKTNI